MLALLGGCALSTVPVAGQDGGADARATADVPALPDGPLAQEGSVPPDAAADAPPNCTAATPAGVRIALRSPDGAAWDCSAPRPTGMPAPVQHFFNASVVSAADDDAGSHLVLELCSPATDCAGRRARLDVRAPNFLLASGPNALRPGQYLSVRVQTQTFFTCTTQLEVSNLPRWDGIANPVRSDSSLLAAAADGEASALGTAPFGVSAAHVGCVTASMPNCGGGPPEQLALAFQGSCRTCLRAPDPVLVRQGQRALFHIDGLELEAQNLRSFNTGNCDDYWNFAWTVRETWLE